MPAYYNEIDPYAAAWLRNLIAAGHIAPGDVDERSIVDVQPDDIRHYTQAHFFAGIGGWSLALRHAMWPDDRPVWTGSCPCQPFSAAGKQRGTDDERHLWPVFHRLIAECRPPVVFGEQVASKLGRDWLCGVRADLEALAYAVGATDLCAASVGAPHIRQRLWWVADASFGRHREHERNARAMGRKGEAGQGEEPQAGGVAQAAGHRGEDGRLADAISERRRGGATRREDAGDAGRASQDGWGSHFIGCADGKSRRFEPSIQPLAHGVPGRVGRLRAYGNAIVPQVAAEFIKAWVEA